MVHNSHVAPHIDLHNLKSGVIDPKNFDFILPSCSCMYWPFLLLKLRFGCLDWLRCLHNDDSWLFVKNVLCIVGHNLIQNVLIKKLKETRNPQIWVELRNFEPSIHQTVFYKKKKIVFFICEHTHKRGKNKQGKKISWLYTMNIWSIIFLRTPSLDSKSDIDEDVNSIACLYTISYILINCKDLILTGIGVTITLKWYLSLCTI